MDAWLAVVVGGLFAAGVWRMLQRGMFQLILGLALLSHGVNLAIFTAAGLTRGRPPLLAASVAPHRMVSQRPAAEVATEDAAEGDSLATAATAVTAQSVADPLPQALILTAIVIGFGVLAFTLVLFHRANRRLGSDNLDRLVRESPESYDTDLGTKNYEAAPP